MDASVIVPARDAAATLPACLAALRSQQGAREFEVIVVDDASADQSAEIARAAGARVLAGAGAGPAAARNRGAAAASGALLAFTDADCVPEPGWLDALLSCARGADLVQGKVLPPEGATVGPFDRHLTVLAEYGLYETANLAIRRELFERLGGFESILTPRRGIELGEDVWLGWRARRAGGRSVFCEAAVVRHAVFARGARAYVAERARLRFFPELARRVPELRQDFFYRRVFLNERSARFDLAAAGVLAAALLRHPLPLAAALPYAVRVRRPLRAGAVEAVADAVGLAALVAGSLRSRSLLL